MTNHADLWAELAGHAMQLDPEGLRETILSTHDRLPGGAQSSESGIRAPRMERCADASCTDGAWWDEDEQVWSHSHPIPNDPTGDAAMKPSKSEADLRLLAENVAGYINAVGEVMARSHSRALPERWDEAVQYHHMLAEMDAVTTLENTGQKPAKWVRNAGDALSTIEHLANRHQTRQPNDHEKSWTSGLADEQCCRVCMKLGLRVGWQDGGAGGLCQGCYRLRKRCATVNDLDPDKVGDPPEALVEELRRINNPGGPADMAARSRWYQRVDTDRRHCA